MEEAPKPVGRKKRQSAYEVTKKELEEIYPSDHPGWNWLKSDESKE